jgi:hypothetical protein
MVLRTVSRTVTTRSPGAQSAITLPAPSNATSLMVDGLAPRVAHAVFPVAVEVEPLAGPLAGRLVEYIVDHGPVSASDTKMLRQLDASRRFTLEA